MDQEVEKHRQGHKSYKRFIGTILNQIPPYVEQYPPDDQKLLNDFFDVLRRYKEAEYNRRKLEEDFEKFRKNVLKRKQYLTLPFLWFVGTFLRHARVILNISEFHPDPFYKYITKQLRGNTDILGVYQLVYKNIPLSNLAWETLQYESNNRLYSLSKEQFQIIRILYTNIAELGVYTLNSLEVKAVILNQVEFPKNVKPSDELNRFFTLIDAKWIVHFYSPAFGLERLFCLFQLQDPTILHDVIDFNDPGNTVLTYSDVFRARDLPNTYIGNLLIPNQNLDQLKRYLQHCENQGYFILKALKRITTTRISASLDHYHVNKGWIELSPTKMRRLTSFINSKHPKKTQNEDNSLFISHPFNQSWHFDQHPLSTNIIRLYCKIPDVYSFSELRSISDQDSTTLSRSEIGLLKLLYNNKIIYIGFVPWQLVYEFSLDLYWIILPKISLFRLKQYLKLVPYNEIHYTENSIYILARLTPKLVHWIKNDLSWTVIPITLVHERPDLQFSWFNSETLQWNTPDVLLG